MRKLIIVLALVLAMIGATPFTSQVGPISHAQSSQDETCLQVMEACSATQRLISIACEAGLQGSGYTPGQIMTGCYNAGIQAYNSCIANFPQCDGVLSPRQPVSPAGPGN